MPKKKGGYEKLEETLSRACAELKFYWNSLAEERRPEFNQDVGSTLRTMLREFRRTYELNKPELPYEAPLTLEPMYEEKLLGAMGEMQRVYLNMLEELVVIRKGLRPGNEEAIMVQLKALEKNQQRFEKIMQAYAQTGEGYTTALRESVIAGVERLVAEREERFLRYLSERDKRLLEKLRQNGEHDQPKDDAASPRLVKTKSE